MGKEEMMCQDCTFHKEDVENILSSMPESKHIEKVADFLKLMSDSTRVKILYSLSKKSLCVLDIATIIGMTHSAVSHQLKILKLGRLVKSEKKGKEVYYSLDDRHVEDIFKYSFEHIKEETDGRQ